jgi:hypothetical protein
MIVAFIQTHGNGFWLHSLAAVGIMAVGWWFGHVMYAMAFNTALWPLREAWQKRHAPRDFFRFHPTLEWGCPVAAGLIMGTAIWHIN